MSSSDPLISQLQEDLLMNILQHSEDIGKCATNITTQIREIIGARVVALFERTPGRGHRLIGACPERRKDMFENENLGLLKACAGHLEKPVLIKPGEGEIGGLLKILHMQESFVVPLRVGNESFGFLLLLDIMDSQGIDRILTMLTDVSGLLSLILKNSFLFRNLESLVEQRTSELLESEAKSWAILQVALDGFWIIDRTGRIINVNSAYCRMSGYSSKELLQMTIQDLETVQTDDEVLAHAKKVLEGEPVRIKQYTAVRMEVSYTSTS